MKILRCDECYMDIIKGENYMWGTLGMYVLNEDFSFIREKHFVNGAQHFCSLKCLFKEITTRMEMKNES